MTFYFEKLVRENFRFGRMCREARGPKPTTNDR